MKKILIGICVVVVAFFGLKACKNGANPMDVAKAHVTQQFEGLNCDLSKLDFEKVEVTDETALIKVEGKIIYNEEISLVKEGDEWVIGEPAKEANEADAHAEAAPAEDAHAAKDDQKEHKSSH